jgi:negative regulator of replication initiation
VYDLDGKPIIKYYLNGRRPVYFAVDEETFTLYGAGEDGDPEDNLLVYKLKGLS